MFRCQLSGKVSEPRVSPVRIVTQTRPKTYINYKEVFENDKKKLIEVISEGWEIVEEKLVLAETAEALNNGEIQNIQKNETFGRRSQTIKRGIETLKKS